MIVGFIAIPFLLLLLSSASGFLSPPPTDPFPPPIGTITRIGCASYRLQDDGLQTEIILLGPACFLGADLLTNISQNFVLDCHFSSFHAKALSSTLPQAGSLLLSGSSNTGTLAQLEACLSKAVSDAVEAQDLEYATEATGSPCQHLDSPIDVRDAAGPGREIDGVHIPVAGDTLVLDSGNELRLLQVSSLKGDSCHLNLSESEIAELAASLASFSEPGPEFDAFQAGGFAGPVNWPAIEQQQAAMGDSGSHPPPPPPSPPPPGPPGPPPPPGSPGVLFIAYNGDSGPKAGPFTESDWQTIVKTLITILSDGSIAAIFASFSLEDQMTLFIAAGSFPATGDGWGLMPDAAASVWAPT